MEPGRPEPLPRLAARFVADVHLGKLARHLRMVGFDTLWRADCDDAALLEIARGEGRFLLTRDRLLCEQDDRVTYYVESTEPREQLREVVQHFSLVERVRSGRGFLTLCLECGSPILPVTGEQIAERLPAHVRAEHSEFYLCPRCERIYWKGSHFDRMRAWVQELFGR